MCGKGSKRNVAVGQRKESTDIGSNVTDECEDSQLLCRSIVSFGVFQRI